MKSKRASTAVAVLLVGYLTHVQAQTGGILLEIEKHAVFTAPGTVLVRIHVTCGPFAGVEEFQDAHAGGSQQRTGAAAETGIDGTVVCDGVERTHTAHLTSFTGPTFKHGPMTAQASLNVCMLVEDEQTCFSGATSRRVIIRGGTLR